ncbi:MAG: serine/threonine-protein kinase [Myxococcales bacterium]
MRDPEIGDHIDQYRLTELIANGGMASIFKAVDGVSGAVVALKVPYFHYESDVVFFERFRREEEIGLRLDHPGIVKVLTPREKSRMYLAMEFVAGQPLRALMQPGKPLPTAQALAITRQVGEALAYMHAQGIVHRDVKPENLIITPEGKVKISDFGIAWSRGARRLTWSGLSHSTGTPGYAAPEQIRGGRGDARTDVHALGMLLYELLTGRLPWEAPDLVALLRAKRRIDATPPSAYSPGLDRALEAVVLRAIARDPADRQTDAAALLGDLQNPSAMVARPARRHRLAPRRAISFFAAGTLVVAIASVAHRCGRAGAIHGAAANQNVEGTAARRR